MSTKVLAASHSLRVTRLYRASLKNLLNWTVWREMWIEKAFELRAEFDANKHVTDPKQLERIMTAAEARLAEFRHPDPYVLNHMPGGTKYQRYPRNGLGLPPEVCALPSYLK